MSKEIIPIERVVQSIRWIRGQKVLLDSDLALLYGVATKVLNQAAKRNRERFPEDFMFQLNTDETRFLRSQFVTLEKRRRTNWSQIVTSSGKRRGKRYRPYAFTEQGVAMLSSALKSERSGERTRLACWRWRPRHRGLFLRPPASVSYKPFGSRLSATRRKEHARRVRSPE
jgi:hypothetical protein